MGKVVALYTWIALLILVPAATFMPVALKDDVTVTITPQVSLAPAKLTVTIRVRRPIELWCPYIAVDVDDGAWVSSQESDCDPEEPNEVHADWSYTVIPSKGSHQRIFGPGEHIFKITLRQGKKEYVRSFSVQVSG